MPTEGPTMRLNPVLSCLFALPILGGCLSADAVEVIDLGAPISQPAVAQPLGTDAPVTYFPRRYGVARAAQLWGADDPVERSAAWSALSLDLGAARRGSIVRETVTTALYAHELGDLLGLDLGVPLYLELAAGAEVTGPDGEPFGDAVVGVLLRRPISRRFASGLGFARIGDENALMLSFSLSPPVAGR